MSGVNNLSAVNYAKVRILTLVLNLNKLKTIQNNLVFGKIQTMQLTRQQYIMLQNLITIQL